ncbi:MAG TPA: transglycosylase SLT domain-containing protein [Candidatus Methylomirabilis sp.]|nr:transglycosylase SLT domain-containing protein [Candidatus Methylomirabilis sp.]
MGMGRAWIAIFIGSMVLLAPIALGHAAVYGYVDAQGTAHFTDAPTLPHFRPLPAFGLPRGVNLVRGQYAGLINQVALEEGVDPELVRAIIKAESNFDTYALSRRGARGLMQLMPGTAGRYSVTDIYDPEANIRGGVRYLRHLQDLFPGRLPLALAAYNAGEQVVLRYGRVPPYSETQRYVDRVLGAYGRHDLSGDRSRALASRRRSRTELVELDPSPPTVYRTVDADGTPRYTNIPPVVRRSSGITR